MRLRSRAFAASRFRRSAPLVDLRLLARLFEVAELAEPAEPNDDALDIGLEATELAADFLLISSGLFGFVALRFGGVCVSGLGLGFEFGFWVWVLGSFGLTAGMGLRLGRAGERALQVVESSTISSTSLL